MKVYMFHYVKPFSKYHHFNLDLFEKVVNHLVTNYKVISLKEFDQMNKKNNIISDEYVMLTFDDGTIDHFKYVYPVLKKYNCSGLFFIPFGSKKQRILDIQLIHQLLEKVPIDIFYEELKEKLLQEKIDIEEFQTAEMVDIQYETIIKQLLQYMLPDNIRKKLFMHFCKKYNLSTSVNENYMGIKEMQKMKKDNMYFGVHTCNHYRLSMLSKIEQEKEIKENMDYLFKNEIIEKELCSLAFPYGSYNEDTLEIMAELNIKYGFKVDTKKSKSFTNIVMIDRIDCNSLKNI